MGTAFFVLIVVSAAALYFMSDDERRRLAGTAAARLADVVRHTPARVPRPTIPSTSCSSSARAGSW